MSENDLKFELVTGYIDGELTQQEAQKISLLIETDQEYQAIYQELLTMRKEVQSLSLQEQELEHLDQLFNDPISKTAKIFGLAALAISFLVIVGFTIYKILWHPEISLLEKSLVSFISLGSLGLLFSVLRQRLINLKKDKYKGVKI